MLETRLCRRGEAWCGTAIRYDVSAGKPVLCKEPAAVAYRVASSCRWSYACRKHYGARATDELRSAARAADPTDKKP